MTVREIDCNGPGLTRKGAGKGFYYADPEGNRVEEEEVLARIRSLAIPPAWTDVWICSDPLGHIQATGVDDKGRRQYRYHTAWQEQRAREKHERVVRFARLLPDLRQEVHADFAREGMPRERVLACAVRLLEMGFFRTGGEAYAEENGSYGLATLQKRHVRIRGDVVHFDYDAKSGQHRRCQTADPDVVEVLTHLRRRRTSAETELLAYKDGRGRWVDVRSSDINEYLQEHLGTEFTAKDFRTWAATVLAAVGLADVEAGDSDTARRRAVVQVAKDVARHLGNTPAVARSAYIDPRVIDAFEQDETLDGLDEVEDLEELEAQVLSLIERAERARRRQRRRRSASSTRSRAA
ncbi:MAG: DNA topoisomerase IB [Actinomycetota bacterium]